MSSRTNYVWEGETSHGAKIFTTLDVRTGFGGTRMGVESFKLITFNTPSGRYRWKRIWISYSPEVFLLKMHELIEGIYGVEVLAGDFAAFGCGLIMEAGVNVPDHNLLKLLEHYEQVARAL